MQAVFSLCDKSANMVRPWAEAGYPCYAVDVQHAPGIGEPEQLEGGGLIYRVGCDVRRLGVMGKWAAPRIMFAFPPCTHLASSGARWWKGKGLHLLAEAIEIVAWCADWCEASGAPWMLENPIGALATHWRKPDYSFDPCDYGDPYTKRTCLWTGGGFVMPPKAPVLPLEGSKMHLMPPSADRADKRSETPMGFARAVFEANSK